MSKTVYIIFCFILLYGGCQTSDRTHTPNDTAYQESLRINVFFSQTHGNYKEGGGIDMRLIHDIDKAEEEILVAIYAMTNDRIRDALIRAHKRACKVTVVTDDHQIDDEDMLILQKAGIPVFDDADPNALMHDKFTVIDGKIVWSGSCNYTYYAFYRNYENLVSIKSTKIATLYKEEFQELLAKRYREGAYHSKTVEIYFSPEDDFQQRLLELIENAKEKIDFLAFAFTSRTIADALLAKAQEGLQIRGVFDKRQNSYQRSSEYDYLRTHQIPVYLDANPFTLHDKVMIIDDTVVTGSYNFTEKANDTNNENSIVVHNADFTGRYEREFEKIYKEAKEKSDQEGGD